MCGTEELSTAKTKVSKILIFRPLFCILKQAADCLLLFYVQVMCIHGVFYFQKLCSFVKFLNIYQIGSFEIIPHTTTTEI